MAETAPRKPLQDQIPEDAREHMRAARDQLRESWMTFFPPEFLEHRRKARREMLLAWRSFIDHALQRMDEKDAES